MKKLTGRQMRALRNEHESYTGLFLEFSHPNGYAAMWSGVGIVRLVDQGVRTYIGVGDALSFSGLISTERTKINNLSFSLSNVPEEMAVVEASVDVRGHTGKLSWGLVGRNHQVIDDLVEIQSFDLDKIDMVEGKDSSTLVLQCFSGIADLTTPSNLNWSKAAQEKRLEGTGITDTGFDNMSTIRDSVDVDWRVGNYDGRGDQRQPDPVSVSDNQNLADKVKRREFFVPGRRG